MMYRIPSSKRRKKDNSKLNLTPILDAIFILIFFLVMSANFLKVFEIQSEVPLVSDATPPKNEKPLALTVRIYESGIKVYTGIPSQIIKDIPLKNKIHDLESLHTFLVSLKKKHPKENDAILEPKYDITYEEIVNIMDHIRQIRKTDDSIFIKDKNGFDVKLEKLFEKIVFANIMS